MNAIWFWVCKYIVTLVLCVTGVLIVCAWYFIIDLMDKFKRKKKKKEVLSDDL